MNVSRGLFRAWVAISALWLIGVAFVTAGDWNSVYVRTQVAYFKRQPISEPVTDRKLSRPTDPWGQGGAIERRHRYDSAPTEVEQFSEAHEELETLTTAQTARQIDIEPHRFFSLYVISDTPTEEVNRQVDMLSEIARQRYGELLSEKRISLAQTALAAAILPPMALFGLGWMLLWVARGFKRDRA